jgi:hypothetical protein
VLLRAYRTWLTGAFFRKAGKSVPDEIPLDGPPVWMLQSQRWLSIVFSTTFLIWGVCAYFPESPVVFVARVVDRVLWSHIFNTNYDACTTTCRAYAFGMIAPLICWPLSAIGARKIYCATMARNDWFDRYQLPRTTDNSRLARRFRADAQSYLFRCWVVFGAFFFLCVGVIPVGLLSVGTEAHGKNFFDSGMQFYWAIFMTICTAGTAGQGFYIAFFGNLRDPPETRVRPGE